MRKTLVTVLILILIVLSASFLILKIVMKDSSNSFISYLMLNDGDFSVGTVKFRSEDLTVVNHQGEKYLLIDSKEHVILIAEREKAYGLGEQTKRFLDSLKP